MLIYKTRVFYSIIGFQFSLPVHLIVDHYVEFNTFLWGVFFIREVLITKDLNIIYDNILKSLIVFNIILTLVYSLLAPLFYLYWLSDIISPLFGAVHSIVLLGGLIIFYKKRPLIIRLLFIASIAMALGVWIQVLQAYGVFPYGIIFFDYAIYIGILFLPFWGSMSISVQIKNLRNERDLHIAKLMQADKMVSLGTLASSVAHEISNPNSAISSNVSFISKIYPHLEERLLQTLDPESKDLIGGLPISVVKEKITQGLNGIAISSQKIKTIVNEMRNFYKSSEFEQSQNIRINDIINSTLNLLDIRIQSAHIAVKTDLTQDLPEIQGNPQHIEQILINILLNSTAALKKRFQSINTDTLEESHEKPCIWITTRLNNKQDVIEITIQDNGTGMDQETLAKVYDAFFTTQPEEGGSGLGLYICRKLVQKYKGAIHITSEKSKKTKVQIFFPYHKEN